MTRPFDTSIASVLKVNHKRFGAILGAADHVFAYFLQWLYFDALFFVTTCEAVYFILYSSGLPRTTWARAVMFGDFNFPRALLSDTRFCFSPYHLVK